MRIAPTKTDLTVYGLILLFGALQFVFYLRSAGFFDGDATYVELARSLVEKRPYGFDHKPETRFPPGFPLILALISPMTGFNFGAMVRVMTVFTVLGFIASYEWLRREEGRFFGAVACLLLVSSPAVFEFATQSVLPELPYLLFTFLVLLASRELEAAEGVGTRIASQIAVAVALVASLMLRTAALTLLTGLILWMASSYVTEKKLALRRLGAFLPLLLLGILVQTLWAYWAKTREVAEWPLKGYPGSYFTEAWLKRGNYPELGNASIGEIALRLGHNLVGYGVGLTTILSRKDYIVPLWFSPAIIVPPLLVGVGVASRILRDGGGLQEWYFVSYMAMFLLWPWDYEIRFFLPVAPLACLYLWSGIKGIFCLERHRSKTVALVSLCLSVALSVCSAAQGSRVVGAQPKLSTLLWVILSVCSVVMLRRNLKQSTHMVPREPWFLREVRWRQGMRAPRVQVVALAVTLFLVVLGLIMQIQIGRDNLRFDYLRLGDVRAAQYVNLHMDRNAVIMAGHTDIVYHYCRRRVVWLPPISNPQLLMDGIQRHKVNFIVVIERSVQYFLPPEHDCFNNLSNAYPGAFRLAYHDPTFNIYEVLQQRASLN